MVGHAEGTSTLASRATAAMKSEGVEVTMTTALGSH
jgi:hypothetical protein